MAKRLYFKGMTREWLEKRRNTLLDARANGQTISVVQAAGVRTERQVEVNTLICLQQVEHDLCALYPAEFPPAEMMPIKRTRPRYLS